MPADSISSSAGRGGGEPKRIGGGGDHVEVLDAVGHPARRAAELDPDRGRVGPELLEQLLTRGERAVEHDPLARFPGSRLTERAEDRLLGLRPEPLERPDSVLLGGGAERVERVDPELLVQPPRPLGPEPGQSRDLDQAGRELRAQLDQRRNRPVVGEREHLLLDDPPDARQLRRPPLPRHRGHRHGRIPHRLRGIAIRHHPMDHRPIELIQIPQLIEGGGDFGVRRIRHRLRVASQG